MSVVVDNLVQTIGVLGIPGYGPDEVRFMGNTVFWCEPEVVYEWGTNRGSSARIWYEATRHLPGPPLVHTIDLPDDMEDATPEHVGLETGLYVRGIDRVRQWRGDGVQTALDLYGEEQPSRALFFIDGDHREEAVTAELLLLADEAPTATLLLHDTNHNGPPLPTGPAAAVRQLRLRTDRYRMIELKSAAGMIRLWPKEG